MGQKEILGCSFVLKIYKIGQEMAELWLFSHWEVAWFQWEPHWTKGDPLVFICAKKISNLSRNGWVIAIFPLRGCVISMRTTWDQRGSFCVHLCQKDPKSVNKWLGLGFLSPEHETKGDPVFIHTKSFKISQEMAKLLPFSPWEIKENQRKCFH